MSNSYTAITKQDGNWWVGWIEEIPGVNCQEKTREELLGSLKTALKEAGFEKVFSRRMENMSSNEYLDKVSLARPKQAFIPGMWYGDTTDERLASYGVK